MDSAQVAQQKRERDAFIDALSQTCNVSKTCELSGVPRRTAYNWRNTDPEFAAAWDAALYLGADALEDEAVRRGHEGVDEPVFYQGAVCGAVRKYSDTLLIFMLKAQRPDKYRERVSTELTGRDGGPVELSELDRASRVAALLTRNGTGRAGLSVVGGTVGTPPRTPD